MNETNPDLVEARGQGAELFDAPSLFYLTHRRSIEAWHSLRRPAREVVDRYLMTLAEPLEELAVELGGRLEVYNEDERFPVLALFSSGDGRKGLEPPSLLAGVEWDRNHVRVHDPANAPIVGVRVSSKHHDELRQRFLDAGDPPARHVRDHQGYQRTAWWPALTRCVGPETWWSDLDGYRDLLTTAVRQLIDDFKPALDETLPRP